MNLEPIYDFKIPAFIHRFSVAISIDRKGEKAKLNKTKQ